MFNVKRTEKIRKDIQTSTLLSDHEKSDWLNLLELMNDKQLGELEEILAAEPAAAAPASQSVPPAAPSAIAPTPAPVPFEQKLPPLTHIANIPTDVNMTHSVPTRPNVAPPKPNYIKPGAPGAPGSAPSAAAKSPQASQPAPAQAAAPQTPASKTPPASAPARPKNSAPAPSDKPYVIQNADDLHDLSVETLRAYNWQTIFDAVRKSIEANGYFPVLQLIESAPLYASYIEAGRQRLGGSGQSTLTQAEFEFMTDLLRNMRFNRW